MKRRFVIPAAVAMALHAMFLFGFRTGHPAVIRHDPPDTTAPQPPDAIKVDWSTVPDDLDAALPSGRPDAARPDLPEPPPRENFPEIPMSPVVSSPAAIGPAAKIPTGPFGPGSVEGIGPAGGPINSALLDHAPRTRAQVAPVYPYEARITGRPGEVLVAFVVDETGRVLDPHVVRSSDPVFEATTLRAVAKWRFEPGHVRGRPVRFRMAVPVAFTVSTESGN